MNQDQKRTVAYICPSCKASVAVERTSFQLLAGENEIACPCGKSSLITTPLDSSVRIAIPCISCGKDHVVECPQEPFLTQPILAFSCGSSGLDCCYIGTEDTVFQALASLEESVDKLAMQGEEGSAFLDEIIMHEILSQIKDIAEDGGISCTCGCREWSLQIKFSSVELCCAQCDGILRIPAATADHLEHLCYKSALEIQSKGGTL